MNAILINVKNNIKEIMLVENDELREYYIEDKETKNLEGNIYNGKVVNIIEGMQSAFIDIGEPKNTFMNIKDALPKQDEASVGYIKKDISNIKISSLLKANQNILVQVKKDAVLRKRC